MKEYVYRITPLTPYANRYKSYEISSCWSVAMIGNLLSDVFGIDDGLKYTPFLIEDTDDEDGDATLIMPETHDTWEVFTQRTSVNSEDLI